MATYFHNKGTFFSNLTRDERAPIHGHDRNWAFFLTTREIYRDFAKEESMNDDMAPESIMAYVRWVLDLKFVF